MQGVCIETGVGCISQRGVLEGFPGRGASRNYVDQPILEVNSTLCALHALHLILCAHMRLLTFPTKRFVEGLPQFSPRSGRNYVVASQDSIAATIAFCVVHPAHRRDCKALLRQGKGGPSNPTWSGQRGPRGPIGKVSTTWTKPAGGAAFV